MKISMQGSLSSLTGAATLLAAALGLNLLGPHRAYAAPQAQSATRDADWGVTILSPDTHQALTGLKPVEISAFYQGTASNPIVAVELYLDGVRAATKTLDVPEARGVVSFLIDSSQLSAGNHKVVIRATAADQEVKSAKTAFDFGEIALPSASAPTLPAGPVAGAAGLPPTIHIIKPTEDGRVQGVVTLRVDASDPSGRAPYVSLFIDKTFKTLRNFAPYEFEWDTTGYPNGYHTIEVYGYNDTPNVSTAKTMQLYVNNPGGETGIRRDLLDGAKPTAKPIAKPAVKAAAKPAPKKSVGRPLPLRRPDLLTDAAPQMASMPSAPAANTQDVLHQMAQGGLAPRFDPLGYAGELSTPFAEPLPRSGSASSATLAAPSDPRFIIEPDTLTPLRGFKPLPAQPAPAAAAVNPNVNPDTATLAETPALRPGRGKAARLQRMASGLRLPGSELASPFLAAPTVSPAALKPTVRTIRTASKSALKTHPVRAHLPAHFGSLLRAAGQTALVFNHTTVQLDRPLTAQGSVLFGPLRQIFEQSGGTLSWEARTGTVRAKSATKDITLVIGQETALVNTKPVMMGGKPYIQMGRTMVPLAFAAAAMDADVQFDAATGHLLITSRK